MQWTEVTVLTTTQASEMVSAILEQAGSKGVMIEDKNDVYANQRPEGQWDIIDEAIAERIGDDVRVTGYYPVDERLADTMASIREGISGLRAQGDHRRRQKLDARRIHHQKKDHRVARPPVRIGARHGLHRRYACRRRRAAQAQHVGR